MAWTDGLDPNSTTYSIAAYDGARLRVVAGPGTGKSFALKRRVARLLEAGVSPHRILPVTFTRVAAEDLHRELVSLGVRGCEELQGRTLHSLGLRVLRRQHVLDSTGRVPRPLNQFEMEPLLYDLPGQFGNKRRRRRRIRAFEAAWARLQHEQPGFPMDPVDENFEGILIDWLRFHKAMLIGEIVPQVYQYLRDNPGAPEHDQYHHVLVDEFQDLNKAEQRVVEMLGERCAICIVGDDDQSIYSFKHANPEGIRNWHEIHAEAADKLLLVCRRCPTRIVRIANSLIRNNRNREDRQLNEVEDNGEGDISIIQYVDLEEEAAGVADFVSNLIQINGVPPGDILILAQRRVIGNPIYDELRFQDIPVKSYYQESELDSLNAQERVAIFKLLVDRSDRVALRWLLGLGSDDFRAGAYARVRCYSEAEGLSPWTIMTALSNGEIYLPHTGRLRGRFDEILSLMEELEQRTDLNDFITHWLPEDLEAVDGLRELAISCVDECASIEELLEAILTEIAQPEIPLEVSEVRIMSLHKSKGLSSPVVIIAGCVEGLLPARPDDGLSAEEQAAFLEEQRRLFFVGLTRVKADLPNMKPGILRLTSSRRMPQADALGAGIVPAFIRYGDAYVNASRFFRELGPNAPAPERGE